MLNALDPDLATWIGDHTDVASVLGSQPVPVLDLTLFGASYLNKTLRP
ncbi:hypothetical protein [Arthrobacter sp. H5]|nr:hypothetical protein [Arthrobacter sp. H5]